MDYYNPKTLIVIPTYNEADNIFALVYGIFTVLPDTHILFIDDNSPDGTQQKIKEEQQNYVDKIFLLTRPQKLGLGSAYISGFKWAIERGYDYIIEMDADLSHDPKYLKDMIEVLNTSDVAIGSRYVPGGGIENWGLIRRMISRFGSLYAQIILNLPICDLTGGFNGWKLHVLKQIDLNSFQSEGYCFQIELKYKAYLKKIKIKEFPIIFIDRRVGQSKMSFKIFIEAIYKVWKLKFCLNKN